MSDEIRLENLSDRDLLVMTAQTVNRIANDHENRLRVLEVIKNAMLGAWALLLIFLGSNRR